MDITASREDAPDYEQTARLATAAFAPSDIVIDAEHLRWFYEKCFLKGATVIALRKGSEKVGHFAIIRQTILQDGVEFSAAQLVDLFISKDARGRASLRAIYAAVEAQFREENIRFAIGMPNKKAGPINEHFFDLRPFLKLPIYIGVPIPFLFGLKPVSVAFDVGHKPEMLAILAKFRTDVAENGLPWDGHSLFERLTGPRFEYGLHTLGDVLVISSPRVFRGLKVALICCIRTNNPADKNISSDVHRLFNEACRTWGTLMFLYVGINNKILSVPGLNVPDVLRPSPMLVQMRDFRPEQGPLRLDRYELIDFDFA